MDRSKSDIQNQSPEPSSSENQIRVALVQMCSTHDVQQNWDSGLRYVREAAHQGAQWVLFPENVFYIRCEGDRVTWRETLTGDVVASFFNAAREYQVYILLGSIPEPVPHSERIYNTSVFIGSDGKVITTYRKLHLFDAILPDGRVLNESKFVEPGTEVVMGSMGGIRVGLSICYDLRFPELYRALTNLGSEIVTVPSAFTVPTGRSHWEVLLRARAIENQVFILAPAQTGRHSPSRSSYGHSMVVDPWGEVLAVAGEEETMVVVNLDLNRLQEIRRRMPCLEHKRLNMSR